MDGTTILTMASELLEAYGDNAKFHAAEQMDHALETDDGAAYDQWCLVAKAINLMSMARTEAKTAKADKPAPVVRPAAFKAA